MEAVVKCDDREVRIPERLITVLFLHALRCVNADFFFLVILTKQLTISIFDIVWRTSRPPVRGDFSPSSHTDCDTLINYTFKHCTKLCCGVPVGALKQQDDTAEEEVWPATQQPCFVNRAVFGFAASPFLSLSITHTHTHIDLSS